MLYIITEDSNSARDFWKCVAKTFRAANTYTLVPLIKNKNGKPSAGNTTLNTQVLSILPNLQSGDTLFIAFDNIAATKGFNPYNFINKVHSICNGLGINVKFTSYYCFEELYLSYEEVFNMYSSLSKHNKIILEALKYVYNSINSNHDYYDKSKCIQDFINIHSEAGRNREHFANALLLSVTQALNGTGHFVITKSSGAFDKQAECWLKDCNTIQSNMPPQQIKNVCNCMCNYCCKYKTVKERLIDLDIRSLCRNSSISLQQI